MHHSEPDPNTGDPRFLSVMKIPDEQVFFSKHIESQNRVNFQIITPDHTMDWKTCTL